MIKKPLFITLIIIAIATLGITEFTAVSSFRAAKKLTEAVDKLQRKQGEMEGKLGEIEGKVENSVTGESETPMDDEIENWKTYTSRDGYMLKYPNNWTLEEADVPLTPYFTYSYSDDDFCRLHIVATDVDNEGEIKIGREEGYEETNYSIAGISAIRFRYSPVDRIYFSSGSKYYKIYRTSFTDSHEDECQGVIDQILSTFKFNE